VFNLSLFAKKLQVFFKLYFITLILNESVQICPNELFFSLKVPELTLFILHKKSSNVQQYALFFK